MEKRQLEILLAQVCVVENGLSGKPEECLEVWETHRKDARKYGTSLQSEIIRTMDKKQAARWIYNLRDNGDTPSHWPNNYPWDQHKNQWMRYLNLSKQYLSNAIN